METYEFKCGPSMSERTFSHEERMRLAKEGKALPDGSYPTPDKDALHRAFQSYGRETPEKRSELRHYLIRRAIEMGHPEMIPDSWHVHPK